MLLTGLWVSINWFVLNIGLVDSSKQEAELFGDKQDPGVEGVAGTGAEEGEIAGRAGDGLEQGGGANDSGENKKSK